jgi:hypothetical protein
MAKLIYSAPQSLDGCVADEDGNSDWAEPDEEVHTFINDLERPVGTYPYGRRMYEVMVAWETLPLADQPPFMQDFAEMWRSADKIVYSNTLKTLSSAKTRIESDAGQSRFFVERTTGFEPATPTLAKGLRPSTAVRFSSSWQVRPRGALAVGPGQR